jgi:phosphoribosylglycinamide formyltransferase-1
MLDARGKLKLAVLISGRGSNLLAMARACTDGRVNASIELVLSDRAAAEGLIAAAAMGLATMAAEPGISAAAREAKFAAAIDRSGAGLILLAGFMRVLSPAFVGRYAGRLVNIHPSLLPQYRGLHTHRRVLEAGDREHGASVHFVTAELDGGPVICQARVAVYARDTEHTLAARVLEREHRLYPFAVRLIADGRVRLGDAGVLFDGRLLPAPLEMSDDA